MESLASSDLGLGRTSSSRSLLGPAPSDHSSEAGLLGKMKEEEALLLKYKEYTNAKRWGSILQHKAGNPVQAEALNWLSLLARVLKSTHFSIRQAIRLFCFRQASRFMLKN